MKKILLAIVLVSVLFVGSFENAQASWEPTDYCNFTITTTPKIVNENEWIVINVWFNCSHGCPLTYRYTYPFYDILDPGWYMFTEQDTDQSYCEGEPPVFDKLTFDAQASMGTGEYDIGIYVNDNFEQSRTKQVLP